MNHSHKHLIVAGLLAGLAFGIGAQTPPAAPLSAPAPGAMRERYDAAKRQEHMAKREAQLKHMLQITPAQESAWTAYTTAMKPPANFRRPERGELDKLTTPERMDRVRAMRAARDSEMDKRAEAAKTLYAALAPDQKKVFDAETAPRRDARHHRGRGHRWG